MNNTLFAEEMYLIEIIVSQYAKIYRKSSFFFMSAIFLFITLEE